MKLHYSALLLVAIFTTLLPPIAAGASPFGQGKFGANIPFGAATSLAINLGGNVSMPLVFSGNTASGTGSHTVTVTSTDTVGYYLYAHTNGNSNMTNGSATITASNNASAGPLTAGSWGYNTNSSTVNFLGMSNNSNLLKDTIGPFKDGDPTLVTYGALTSNTQEAGNYSVNVTYTVVAKNQ